MRILIALTYYEPNKSGLTIYAVREARALAALGHQVTVLTSQFEPDLPLEEMDQSVRIVRVPVAFHLSKGVVMPRPTGDRLALVERSGCGQYPPAADRFSTIITLLAKWQRKPVVLTYHCYLDMPRGLISRLAGWGGTPHQLALHPDGGCDRAQYPRFRGTFPVPKALFG